jgi:hypothetical protein
VRAVVEDNAVGDTAYQQIKNTEPAQHILVITLNRLIPRNTAKIPHLKICRPKDITSYNLPHSIFIDKHIMPHSLGMSS